MPEAVCRCHSSFFHNPAEEVMEAMSLIAPIKYEIKKNKVYITPRK